MLMTCEELERAIIATKEEIEQLKSRIRNATDPKENRRLKQQLKEL